MNQSSKKLLRGVLISLPFLVGLLLLLVSSLRKKTTSQIIADTISKGGYPNLALLWVAVSKFETANFTSSLFKNNNNAFGFTFSVNDPYNSGYTSGSNGFKWAKYKTVQDSANAIVNYMDRFKYPSNFQSVSEFVSFMKSKNYFGDGSESDYLNGVKKYL